MSPTDVQEAPSERLQSQRVAILTCPRCGHVNRMAAESYEIWTEGILCGLCGPPYARMRARITL
jgi:transcription elongation factor Elf1